MAGSGAQSVENLAAQGMERHQIMMNNEFMKHFGIMNRASVREIMLQHERTFKEQVHDLHKLYEVQRLLMEKAKGSGQPLSAQVSALPEAPHQSEQVRKFWEQLPSGSERVVSGGQSASTGQDKSKSSNSTVRKRKIDLEQLPADDSDDDEMGSTLDAFNPITSAVSDKSKEVTQGHHGHTNTVTCGSSVLYPFQPSKGAQSNATLIRDSGYGGTTNLLAVNSTKADQSPIQMGAKNPAFQIGNVLNSVASDAGISNGSMLLPQLDLKNRASNGVGREAPCFSQSSNAQIQHMGLHSVRVSSQPLQHTHLPAPQLPLDKRHQQSSIFQSSSILDPRNGNKKSAPMESLLGITGEWMKAPAEDTKPSVGLQTSPEPPKVWPFASPKRPGDMPNWYTSETFPKGTQLGSIAPLAMAETRPAEGGYALASLVTPALAVANSKGPRQEHNTTTWSPQKSVMQHSQLQQPTSFSPQVLPALSQAIWLPSPQKSHSSPYSQQIIYGGHLSDASHIGYLSEALPKHQSDATGLWSMTGLGPYYSSASPIPQQKPSFKKPPKLVLKNDGAGMELRLASPEGEDLSEKTSQRKLLNLGDEPSERTCQRKPLSSVKDSPRSSSESRERKPNAKRDAGKEQKHVDVFEPLEIQGSTMDSEPPMIFSGLSVSMPAAFHVQENVLPCPSTTPSNHVSQNLINSSALLASSAPSLNGTGAQNLQGTNVSRRKDQESLMQQLESINTGAPSSTGWDARDALTKGGLQGHPLLAMRNNSSCMKDDAVDEGDDAPSSAGLDALTKGGMQGHSLLPMENKSSFMKGDAGGHLTCHGGDNMLVPIGSREPLLTATSSRTPEDAKAALSQVSARQESAFEGSQTGQSESSSMEPQHAAVFCEKRAEGFDANLCQEDKPRKGSHASQLAALEKDAPVIKNVPQGTLLGHGFEMSPSREPVMPAVSMQSTSSGTPGFVKQEKKTCYNIGGLDNSASHRASGKSSSVHQSRTTTTTYDRDCPSFMSESKPDTRGNVSSSSEDFEQDSDSDNLAATILLSFAPKIDLQHREKPPKDNAGSSSAGSRKRKLADAPASSRTRQSDGAMAGVQSVVSKSKEGQRPRVLMQCSPKKVGHVEPGVKSRMKDRRRDEQCATEPPAEKKGEESRRSGTFKLPRVVAMGSLTDEAFPTWKSKQLNKIDGAMVSSKSANSLNHTKSKDVFHAPTGRRSSRGPPPSVRAHHSESKGRTHQRLDGGDNPALTDWHSRSREEGGDSKKKAPEVNMKSKAWGDQNKARGHVRKPADELSQKKIQRWLSRESMPSPTLT